MTGIRVILQPLTESRAGRLFILGAQLELFGLGKGAVSFTPEESKPATLHFSIGFIDKLRPTVAPTFERFARIDGQLMTAPPQQRRFVLPLDAEPAFVTPPPTDGKLARELTLRFDPGTFENAPREGAPLSRLRLPDEPEGFRFAEVAIELEIDGAIVSDASNNDRLDLLLREFLELTLIDEDEVPMSGARYRVLFGALEVAGGVLDDAGFARVEDLPAKQLTVVFPELGIESVRRLPREQVPPDLL